MSSSFTGSYGDDDFMAYDPRLASKGFNSSFSQFEGDSVKDSAGDSSPIFSSQSYEAGDEVFSSNPPPDTPSPPSIYAAGGGFSSLSPERNGKSFGGGFGAEDDSILPPPTEIPAEEGFALREWRRQNAIRLEQKEKREKEMLREIIEEAEQFKIEFYRKRALAVENNKASNREKEKLFLASWEKFHGEAEKNYWKAIAELIPYEVPAIEKRGKKKDQEKKKPSIIVIQGPKPGKPTDLSRMRQILVKLKHNPPSHMNPKPPPPQTEPTKDAKTSPAVGSGTATSKPAAPATPKGMAAARETFYLPAESAYVKSN